MPTDFISYQDSGYFASLAKDYLNQNDAIRSLYNLYPSLSNFETQIREKKENYNPKHRKILVSVLQKQYSGYGVSELTNENIQSLSQSNTYTITTGHQLNIFTGPLYFIYKIISTINLASELKSKYPNDNFIPVYWMATEDHDFEEINHFNFKEQKISWNTKSHGPVGRLSTNGLDSVLKEFSTKLDSSSNAQTIQQLFQDSYLKYDNLADATRHLVNSLFGKYGLVILDADNQDLKRLFIPYIKNELTQQKAHKEIHKTITQLKAYPIPVNPREINLFYIENESRERIILEEGFYKINNTAIKYSETEILKLLDSNPEKFSPNVILRPLYQEVVLPNLCYIGGGGEIAYWLELKSFFDCQKITFPMLLIRNSVLIATKKHLKKLTSLHLEWIDLFNKQQNLINHQTKKLSEFPIDFTSLKIQLIIQFNQLYELTSKTDTSFLGAVKAQEVKQLKGLDKLEKRLLKAQKIKLKNTLDRITQLQNELFPNHSLQERQANFTEFYLENNNLIPDLVKRLKPLEQRFEIIVI